MEQKKASAPRTKAMKASGTTINLDCMTGQCESHRYDLMTANSEHWAEIQLLKQKLYMSWVVFGIIGALLIYFRKMY